MQGGQGTGAVASYIGAIPDLKPLSTAIYRRGSAWIDGRKLREQATLLDHGRFLAALEMTALLRDDPALVSGLLLCDIFPWHVADA